MSQGVAEKMGISLKMQMPVNEMEKILKTRLSDAQINDLKKQAVEEFQYVDTGLETDDNGKRKTGPQRKTDGDAKHSWVQPISEASKFEHAH